MKSRVRKIGNSKGVLLPASVLSVCGIDDEVELSVENGRIVIAPAQALREGWFDGYRADEDEDALGELGVIDAGTEDWEW
jgi:antitoxin MazE